ncbi:hypothetical protein EC991_002178 [Linnemannia zychae]|nr:hypothetical protein EC991_002178 [Linnemannia zychae]
MPVMLAAIATTTNADPDLVTYGICTCFSPKYDASCCIPAQGGMFGNVCRTKDFGKSVQRFQDCCARSGGHDKCKIGYRYKNGTWPSDDTYNCKNPFYLPPK